MSVEEKIRKNLTAMLNPTRLEIINESHLHAGHSSSPGTGESHFRILIISELFDGKSRLERHRMVNDALRDELKNSIHALAMSTLSPKEAAN